MHDGEGLGTQVECSSVGPRKGRWPGITPIGRQVSVSQTAPQIHSEGTAVGLHPQVWADTDLDYTNTVILQSYSNPNTESGPVLLIHQPVFTELTVGSGWYPPTHEYICYRLQLVAHSLS